MWKDDKNHTFGEEGFKKDLKAKRLFESETRYRRLFETTQDGILLLNKETGQIDDANPFLCGMLGYSRDELLNKKLWEIGPFVDIAANKDSFEKLKVNSYIRYEDLPLKTKDGKTIVVEFVSNVYPINGKKVIQCNIRDITDRKKLDDEKDKLNKVIKASETRYRRLFETAQDGILILDEATGLINDVNPFLCNMLGYSRDELLKKNIWEIGPFADIPASKIAFTELKAKSYIRYENLPLKTKDGKIVDVEFVSNVYTVESLKVIQCNIREITERKKLEIEREHLIKSLTDAMASIKQLKGLLPICMYCKKIRNDKGYWEQVENYISDHTEAEFSHGLCDDCYKKHYPDLYDKKPR